MKYMTLRYIELHKTIILYITETKKEQQQQN